MSDSDISEVVPPQDIYTDDDTSNEEDNVARKVYATSELDAEKPAIRPFIEGIFSSDSKKNGHPATGVYSPADSDSDLPDAADVYDSSTNDDELRNQLLGFIFRDRPEDRDRNGLEDAEDSTMDPTMGEFQWSLPQFNWYNIISFPVEYHQVTNISPDVWMNLPCQQQVKTWLIS